MSARRLFKDISFVFPKRVFFLIPPTLSVIPGTPIGSRPPLPPKKIKGRKNKRKKGHLTHLYLYHFHWVFPYSRTFFLLSFLIFS